MKWVCRAKFRSPVTFLLGCMGVPKYWNPFLQLRVWLYFTSINEVTTTSSDGLLAIRNGNRLLLLSMSQKRLQTASCSITDHLAVESGRVVRSSMFLRKYIISQGPRQAYTPYTKYRGPGPGGPEEGPVRPWRGLRRHLEKNPKKLEREKEVNK
jgi:hypothetical protein